MIRGYVANRRAYVLLLLRGPSSAELEFEFAVDTGFTGPLTLPLNECLKLGLPFRRRQPSFLANRTKVILDVYAVSIYWDGRWRNLEGLAMDGSLPLGMTALGQHRLTVDSIHGGTVTIEALDS
jgi:predicted aspartyl protease